MTLQTIYQDTNWIVVDKPSGWLSVPSRYANDDPRPVVGTFLQNTLKVQIFPVHRLDFEVSGLLLFALNKECHKIANHWFESHSVIKTYESYNEVRSKEFCLNHTLQNWESKIVRGKKRSFFADYGKPSLTEVNFIKNLNFQIQNFQSLELAKFHLKPKTGRPHQLRLECSKHHVPILGDALYGATHPLEENKIALRAIEIDFSNIHVTQRKSLPNKIQIPGFDLDRLKIQL